MRQEETAANQNERDIILDSLNEGVFTVDSDWRITSFNLAAERITGVPSEEALGKACSDVFHADICEKACALRRTLETGTPTVNTTAHIINIQGSRCRSASRQPSSGMRKGTISAVSRPSRI